MKDKYYHIPFASLFSGLSAVAAIAVGLVAMSLRDGIRPELRDLLFNVGGYLIAVIAIFLVVSLFAAAVDSTDEKE